MSKCEDQPTPCQRQRLRPLGEEQRALIDEHVGLAYAVAFEIFSRRRGADWDEFKSAAHMALIRAAQVHDPELGEFPALVKTVVQRACSKVARKSRLEKKQRCFLKNLDDLPASTKSDEDQQLLSNLNEELDAILPRLPAKEREFIYLISRGWQINEIAAKWKIHRQQVTRVKNKAFRNLKAILEEADSNL